MESAVIELLSSPQAWLAFATLTAMELVLGIDNVVFISILADRLPPEQRALARRVGLGLAMVMRIGLLFLLSWLVGLTATLFVVAGQAISGRDLILIGGGLFLLFKATREIHHLAMDDELAPEASATTSFAMVITQILLIDMVFSLDSIITAVGMVDEIAIMIAAVVVSVLLMMVFAGPISRVVSEQPSIKMLALTFLVMIGLVLVADGLDVHIPKAYVYVAMGFSILVESLNIVARRRKRHKRAVDS